MEALIERPLMLTLTILIATQVLLFIVKCTVLDRKQRMIDEFVLRLEERAQLLGKLQESLEIKARVLRQRAQLLGLPSTSSATKEGIQ